MANYVDTLLDQYEAQLEIVEGMLSATATETEIALALDKAYRAILQYTGWNEFDEVYTSAALSLAIQYLNNDRLKLKSASGERTVSMKTQGSRTESYISPFIEFGKDGLTDDVRAMLPLPKLKVL